MNIHVENNAISTGCLMSGYKRDKLNTDDSETKANPSLNILDENWQGELPHTLSKLYK